MLDSWLGKADCSAIEMLVGKRNTDQQFDRKSSRQVRQKVGRKYLCRLIVRRERNVGQKRNVGRQTNVGRECLNTSIRQSVGKYMSVGKGLCRPDLW
jgi:hypothetical protein